MQYHYHIIPSLKLVIQFYAGNISLKEVMDTKELILNDPAFGSDFKFIIDVSTATFRLSDKDRMLFSCYIKNLVSQGIHIDTAILTNKPNQVVNAKMIDQQVNKNSKHTHEIFSTLKKTVSFFNFTAQEFKLIKENLLQLKRQSLTEKA